MKWQGTLQILNNPVFAKLYENSSRTVHYVGSDVLYVSSAPLLGSLIGYAYYPEQLSAVKKRASDLGVAALIVTSSRKKVPGASSSVAYGTFVIDLRRSVKELWAALEKRCRYAVRKSEEDGRLVFGVASTDAQREEFYALYVASCRANKISPVSREEFLTVISSDHAELLLVLLGSRIVAGAVVLIDYQTSSVEYKWSALHPDARSLHPNNFLHWNIITWAKKRGYEQYDLGGVLPEAKKGSKKDRLLVFKKSFGGRFVPIYSHTLPLHRAKYVLYWLVTRMRSVLS